MESNLDPFSLSSQINNFPHKYSFDSEGKFIFVRHGQSKKNISIEKFNKIERDTNPEYIDSELTEKGISQIKALQEKMNKLKIEKVYVSPYERALKTVSIALSNHPDLKDITVTVFPFIGEQMRNVDEIITDINMKKKEYNLESKVKFDWSLFDQIIKEKNLHPNFFYFDEIDGLESEEKKEFYEKFIEVFKEGKYDNIEEIKKIFVSLPIKAYEKNIFLESDENFFKRFLGYKKFLIETHKETLNDKEKKVITFSHGKFIKIPTNKIKNYDKCNKEKFHFSHGENKWMDNGGIISIYL